MIENIYLESDLGGIESIIQLAIVGFSLFLLGLTIKAYVVSGLKKILFAAGAFGLFSVNLFFEYAEETFDWFEDTESEIISAFIFLIILILFFFAIIKKK
jgi:hypothetical protein